MIDWERFFLCAFDVFGVCRGVMKGITIFLWLAGSVLSLTVVAQEKQIYLGSWDGKPVKITMTIASSGKVSGSVSEIDGGTLMAVLDGTNYSQGKLKVTLKYRFEEFGTYVLTKSMTESKITWSSSSKDFVFSRARTN